MLIIKKYINRRLYNTKTSEYINLDDLYDLIKKDVEFIVIEVKTNKDITRSILTQIIFERENSDKNILPISFLRDLIKFYDDNLRNILPHYLENSMNNFVKNQHDIKEITKKYFDNFDYFDFLEQLTKHNLEFMENNFKNFLSKK